MCVLVYLQSTPVLDWMVTGPPCRSPGVGEVAGRGRARMGSVPPRGARSPCAPHRPSPPSSDVQERLSAAGYLTDHAIATTVFLADRLGKPLLVEGPAGVGKTELAKAVAAATGSELIRLQCYEGLDEARALYEWNYKKQLLRIQAAGRRGVGRDPRRRLRRGVPALPAAADRDPPHRADRAAHRRDRQGRRRGRGPAARGAQSDFQVTIPELGTISGHPPADRVPDLQRHPRAVRGAQAPLPLPAPGLPGRRPREGDRAVPGARGAPSGSPTSWSRPCARCGPWS